MKKLKQFVGNMIVAILLKNPKFVEFWKKIMFDSLAEPQAGNEKSFAEKLAYAISSPTMKQMADLQKEVKKLEDKLTKKTEDFIRTGLVYSKSRKTWARMGKEHDKDKLTYNLGHPLYTDGLTGYRAEYPDRGIQNESGFGLTSDKIVPFSVEKLVNTLFDMKLFTMVEIKAFKVTVTKSPGVTWSQQIIDQIEEAIFDLIEKGDPSLVPYQEAAVISEENIEMARS